MNKFKRYDNRVAVCERHDDEIPVQDGLAYTPSKMMQLAQEGIPISTQTAAGVTFDDGYRTLDFEPLLENRRGIELTDLWEARQDIKVKMKEKMKNPIFKVQDNAGNS